MRIRQWYKFRSNIDSSNLQCVIMNNITQGVHTMSLFKFGQQIAWQLFYIHGNGTLDGIFCGATDIITIYGNNFKPNELIKCKFDDVIIVDAIYVNHRIIYCPLNKQVCSIGSQYVNILISENNVNYILATLHIIILHIICHQRLNKHQNHLFIQMKLVGLYLVWNGYVSTINSQTAVNISQP